MKAVIYCRKSREDADSLQRQEELCREYCERKGYEVVGIYSETHSSQSKGEEYQEMIDYLLLHKGITIVVKERSRLNRNEQMMAELNIILLKQKHKIETISGEVFDCNNPQMKFISSILDAFYQFEYATTKVRMAAGKKKAKESGIYVYGKPPYGYNTVSKRLVVNEEEANIVRRIFKDFSVGKTLKQIYSSLNEEGYTIHGKAFEGRNIKNILFNRCYSNTSDKGEYPEIISKELQEKCISRINSKTHSTKKTYPLSSKVVCPKCGKTLAVGYRHNGVKIFSNCYNSTPYRKRSDSDKCSNKVYYSYDDLQRIVVEKTVDHISNSIYQRKSLLKDQQRLLQYNSSKIEKASAELSEVIMKLDRINKLFISGSLPEEEVREMHRQLIPQRDSLQETINRLESESDESAVDAVKEELKELQELLSSHSIDKWLSLVTKVYFYRDSSEDEPEISVEYRL